MRFNKIQGFGVMLLGLVMLAPAGVAQSAGRDDDRYDAGRGRDLGDYGNDFGYQDGTRHGQADRSRYARYDYRSDLWRRGDRGYQRHMGARGQYIQAYRAGYIRGYEAAYYGRNGNHGRWGRGRDDDWRRRDDDWGRGRNGGYDSRYLAQIAQRNGFEDGVWYGQMDRRNGHSNRPTQVKGYKDADKGYSSSLGNRDDFKRIYRDAFIRGYQQGYGSYGYRR
jgi:hypothetical protein